MDSPGRVVFDAFREHASRYLDTNVPTADLERLADMAIAALWAAGMGPERGTETQWCVWYGGDDPDNCAGRLVYDDQADAEEMVQWIVDGRVARRAAGYTPWVEVNGRG